jgi:hypothetical protein
MEPSPPQRSYWRDRRRNNELQRATVELIGKVSGLDTLEINRHVEFETTLAGKIHVLIDRTVFLHHQNKVNHVILQLGKELHWEYEEEDQDVLRLSRKKIVGTGYWMYMIGVVLTQTFSPFGMLFTVLSYAWFWWYRLRQQE